MPNFDGTGPRGQGSQAGRLRGNCEGAVSVERAVQGLGGGLRQRRRQRQRDAVRCMQTGGRQGRGGFLHSLLESMQAKIENLQAQLDRLKDDSRR